MRRQYEEVVCTPAGDELNPCEDLLGNDVYRAISWLVSFLSITGNVAVLVVLALAHHSARRVHNFLMMNLAFADLCAGLYMAMLTIQDAATSGAYYNAAVDWQTGPGCAAAGFFAVFSSQLSVSSMLLLSFEVWYTTCFAIYGRVFTFRLAQRLMALAWLLALTLAALPIAGVSSYSATSTCLPLDVRGPADRAYLFSGLLINLFAFLGIVVCYVAIYRQVTGTHTTRDRFPEDVQIAKKMFYLIATDAFCWIPTIFLGLTAAADLPLISVSTSKLFLVVFFPINSMANPWLYFFLTRQFRKDMSRLRRKHPWLSGPSFHNSRLAGGHRSDATNGTFRRRSSAAPVTQTTNRPSITSTPLGSLLSVFSSWPHSSSLPRVLVDPLRRPAAKRLSAPSIHAGAETEEPAKQPGESCSMVHLNHSEEATEQPTQDLEQETVLDGPAVAQSGSRGSRLRQALGMRPQLSFIQETSENSHSSNSHSGGDQLDNGSPLRGVLHPPASLDESRYYSSGPSLRRTSVTSSLSSGLSASPHGSQLLLDRRPSECNRRRPSEDSGYTGTPGPEKTLPFRFAVPRTKAPSSTLEPCQPEQTAPLLLVLPPSPPAQNTD